MKLSFITDEATQDFSAAVRFAKEYGFDGVELRSIDDTPIDMIPLDKIREYMAVLTENGLEVSNLASSFYKCELEDENAIRDNIAKLERLCDIGDAMNCHTIRGFGFFKKESFSTALPKIVARFEEPLRILEKRGKRLLLEADPSIYTTNHRLLTELLKAIGSPLVGAIYDPGNDIYDPEGEIPYPDGYRFVSAHIGHVHIKDAVLINGEAECVKIGTGLVDYPGLLQSLKADGYQGYCSLETHYRINANISEELMRLPQGAAFSAGGMEATAESAESFRELVRIYG